MTDDGRPDGPHPRAGTRRRRGCLPRPRRPLPARTAAALLPDRRLGARRRGPGAGDAPGRVARARSLRGARADTDVAVQHRDETLAQRAAHAVAATAHVAVGPVARAARAESPGRPRLAGAVSRLLAGRAGGRGRRARGAL